MKLQRRQLVLLVLASLAMILGIGAGAYHWRAKNALANYKKQLVANGEKLTVEEMTPKPVPPDQDGSGIFLRSLTLMNVPQEIFRTNPPSGMTAVAPGKARVGWIEPDIRSKDATNTWEDVTAVVKELSGALAALEELIERPNLDFNVDYRQGFSTPLPNLAQTKQAAQLLSYAARCDLHRGDTAAATKRIRTMLAMSQGSADERFIISQLVRIAVTAIGAAATWEFLQSPHATEAQLARIQSDWSRLEFSLAAENSIAMERAISQMTIEQMRESSAEFRKVTSGFAWPPAAPAAAGGSDWFDQVEQYARGTWDQTRLKAKETAWRFSWAYTDQLRTLRGIQVLLESARQARTNGHYHAALVDMEEEFKTLGFQNLKDEEFPNLGGEVNIRSMFSESILALPNFLKKVMNVEVSRQMTVTAIALQRHKLAHDTYPPDLAALVPQFLPALPRDPVDGKPLRYRANPDGSFLLYSVGDDGADNGGDASPAKPDRKTFHWQRGRDWVWPQPASLKEIEDFYRRELK